MMSHRRRLKQAFTLVELLVVIGIIAVLVSILLPVLGKAREQANQVKCMSNLKQIALAVLIYEQQYKSLPGPTLRAVLDPEIFENVNPPLNVKLQPNSTIPLDETQWANNASFMKLLGVSMPPAPPPGGKKTYGKSKIWTCPSNVELRDNAMPRGTQLGYNRTPLGYSYRINNCSYTRVPHFFGYWFIDNGEAAGTTESGRPKKLAEVNAPGYASSTAGKYVTSGANVKSHSAIWMLADIDGRNFSDAQSANFGIENGNTVQTDRKWQPIHRKNKLLARNYAFFDGHCETLSLGEGPAGIPGPRNDQDKGQLTLLKR